MKNLFKINQIFNLIKISSKNLHMNNKSILKVIKNRIKFLNNIILINLIIFNNNLIFKRKIY